MVRSPKWKRDFKKECERRRIESRKKSFWERVLDPIPIIDWRVNGRDGRGCLEDEKYKLHPTH